MNFTSLLHLIFFKICFKYQLILFIIIINFFSQIGYCQNNKINQLIKAYPDFLKAFKDNYIIWNDNSKMIYDDRIPFKNFQTKLEKPDLEDQLSIDYPKFINWGNFIVNYDPGRIRYEPFFKKMYGSTKKEVKNNLVAINWLPKTINKKIYITRKNDVNKKLQMVSYELDELSDNLQKYVKEIEGTYFYRNIQDSSRLSTHSYGIAIDINIKYGNYWEWNKNDLMGVLKYRNQIPKKIVEIFEKYGFIWGGKWYHYDTIHFEYRPELVGDHDDLNNITTIK